MRRSERREEKAPLGAGPVLSVLPDRPFDPEPYIECCSLLERWPRRGGGGNLFATAGVYSAKDPPVLANQTATSERHAAALRGHLPQVIVPPAMDAATSSRRRPLDTLRPKAASLSILAALKKGGV